MDNAMTATHCPYCALQCGMELAPHVGSITVAPRMFPTNNGGLCQKGWTSADLLDHPDRITTPLVRDAKGGPLRPASWEEALARVSAGLLSTQQHHGQQAVGVFGGGGLTNEKAYLLGKFARVALRTPNIDYNGRFCMSSAAAASIRALGMDRGLPFPLADIAHTDAILLIGSNAAATMPPVMQYFDAQLQRGGRLIVVDPRATPTAKKATLHIQLTPGSDIALAHGLLHIALRDGLVDEAFIAGRTSGFAELRRVVGAYWPERVERLTGVPVRQLEQAAHILGEASTAMVLTARGPEQQSKGVDTVLSYINLALALGKAGRPLCGYGCLTGQGNGQGGREHGQKADQLPGYRSLANPAHRAHVARVWGTDPELLPPPGRSAYELLDALGPGGVRALLVFGSNIVVSAPNAGHIRQRLESLDMLVVADMVLSETAAMADVVLPTAQWAEETGTMTNLEGRVLLRQAACRPPEGVRTDTEIIAALAAALGCGDMFPHEPEAIFHELRAASAGGVADYSGITYQRIAAEDGVFWPCPAPDHPGTPRLFFDRFATDDGLARFHAVEHRPAAEEPSAAFPLILTTGRVMAQYQSGAQTRRIAALAKAEPQPFVELHPALAASLGIASGDLVVVASSRGRATLRARLSPDIRMDTVFAPFHWGGAGSINLLTSPALDPISRMPEFKVCAVRVEKLTLPDDSSSVSA
ncbi:molybdopterin oxidoreductase family protein [Chloroflexia bacterium SDU3-3]|nr:molybdopterin oxidoreductase family protein [Chloroflexia bacterium SDU3-3]